jgi:integrase-like protein
MDGRGRWMDNVFIERLWRSIKYEEVYLKCYADGWEARVGIGSWITFYNSRRPHQALGDRTPMSVWRGALKSSIDGKAVDMMDNARAAHMPTGAAATRAAHSVRSLTVGNLEQPKSQLRSRRRWSGLRGPAQDSD